MEDYQKNFFVKNGYFKVKLNKKKFIYIEKKVKDLIKKKLNFKKINLENFHTSIELEKLNNFRLYVFKKI